MSSGGDIYPVLGCTTQGFVNHFVGDFVGDRRETDLGEHVRSLLLRCAGP